MKLTEVMLVFVHLLKNLAQVSVLNHLVSGRGATWEHISEDHGHEPQVILTYIFNWKTLAQQQISYNTCTAKTELPILKKRRIASLPEWSHVLNFDVINMMLPYQTFLNGNKMQNLQLLKKLAFFHLN